MNTAVEATQPSTNRFSFAHFESVRTKRVIAFAIDYLIVLALIFPVGIIVFFLGIATFGAGWLLYGILGPALALTYIGWTLGSPAQATVGMRMCSIKLARYDGAPIDVITAIVHAVLFWAANVLLTPFIALVALFMRDKRMLHDLFLGTVVVRSDVTN
ncbi:MAG: RDD family protein [Pseudomonadota bacterium]